MCLHEKKNASLRQSLGLRGPWWNLMFPRGDCRDQAWLRVTSPPTPPSLEAKPNPYQNPKPNPGEGRYVARNRASSDCGYKFSHPLPPPRPRQQTRVRRGWGVGRGFWLAATYYARGEPTVSPQVPTRGRRTFSVGLHSGSRVDCVTEQAVARHRVAHHSSHHRPCKAARHRCGALLSRILLWHVITRRDRTSRIRIEIAWKIACVNGPLGPFRTCVNGTFRPFSACKRASQAL